MYIYIYMQYIDTIIYIYIYTHTVWLWKHYSISLIDAGSCDRESAEKNLKIQTLEEIRLGWNSPPTRIMPFFVGNPYKPSLVTAIGLRVDRNDSYRHIILLDSMCYDP